MLFFLYSTGLPLSLIFASLIFIVYFFIFIIIKHNTTRNNIHTIWHKTRNISIKTHSSNFSISLLRLSILRHLLTVFSAPLQENFNLFPTYNVQKNTIYTWMFKTMENWYLNNMNLDKMHLSFLCNVMFWVAFHPGIVKNAPYYSNHIQKEELPDSN